MVIIRSIFLMALILLPGCGKQSGQSIPVEKADDITPTVRTDNMAKILDPSEIYNKGLHDPKSLIGAERLVFVLQEFDILMDMEGWDHFFLYENHFAWYSEMKDWLKTIDDKDSLGVLQDHESHLHERGVALSPASIEAFLNKQNEDYLRSFPDWTSLYSKLRGHRWEQVKAYLVGQGLTLKDGD